MSSLHRKSVELCTDEPCFVVRYWKDVSVVVAEEVARESFTSDRIQWTDTNGKFAREENQILELSAQFNGESKCYTGHLL